MRVLPRARVVFRDVTMFGYQLVEYASLGREMSKNNRLSSTQPRLAPSQFQLTAPAVSSQLVRCHNVRTILHRLLTLTHSMIDIFLGAPIIKFPALPKGQSQCTLSLSPRRFL